MTPGDTVVVDSVVAGTDITADVVSTDGGVFVSVCVQNFIAVVDSFSADIE